MKHRDAILSAVKTGAHQSREIAQRTGIDLGIVQVRLAELARHGVVHKYKLRPDGRRGRMPKFYRIGA
jgi:predicted ArsR family transcriptional regulator